MQRPFKLTRNFDQIGSVYNPCNKVSAVLYVNNTY